VRKKKKKKIPSEEKLPASFEDPKKKLENETGAILKNPKNPGGKKKT